MKEESKFLESIKYKKPKDKCMFTLLLFACTSELDNKTAATINSSAPKERVEQQKERSPNARELKIDPSSKIEWVGSKVSGDHRGGFQKISGNVMISGSEDKKIEELQAEFDMKSLFSDSNKLTQHLLSPDFFDAESFPKSSFRMTNYEKPNMTGVLTLRGVQKEITFPCELTIDDARVSIKTEFTIQRKDFGIVYPGRPDDLIRDEVLLKLEVKYK
jgi:polyisoprenoid-binding protein YceI